MKDIIAKYKKRKIIKNSWLVAMSLALAFWINYSLQDTTVWKKLQASVIDSTINSNLWDIYLVKNNEKINLQSNKEIKDVKNISLSFTYNPANVKIDSINSSIEWKLNIIFEEEWIKTIILDFLYPNDISSKENILDIIAAKKETKLENINIVNANFTNSKNEVFLFSTSWLEF